MHVFCIADKKRKGKKNCNLSVSSEKMETRYRNNTGAAAKIDENGQKHNNYVKYTNGNHDKNKTHQNGFKKSTLNGHSLKVNFKKQIIFFRSHTLCEFCRKLINFNQFLNRRTFQVMQLRPKQTYSPKNHLRMHHFIQPA